MPFCDPPAAFTFLNFIEDLNARAGRTSAASEHPRRVCALKYLKFVSLLVRESYPGIILQVWHCQYRSSHQNLPHKDLCYPPRREKFRYDEVGGNLNRPGGVLSRFCFVDQLKFSGG